MLQDSLTLKCLFDVRLYGPRSPALGDKQDDFIELVCEPSSFQETVRTDEVLLLELQDKGLVV